MANLPSFTYFWRESGGSDDSWTESTSATFSPEDGVEIEVVSVGPSAPTFIVADSVVSLASISDQSFEIGTTGLLFIADATGTNVEYDLTGPSWLSIDSSSGEVTLSETGQDVGVHNITVTASNSKYSDSKNTTITISSEVISGTFSGDASGTIEETGNDLIVNVDSPSEYAGNYTITSGKTSINNGPVEVVSPEISSDKASPHPTFTASAGLWIGKNGPVTTALEWLSNGEIVATGPNYTRQDGQEDSLIEYRERAIDAVGEVFGTSSYVVQGYTGDVSFIEDSGKYYKVHTFTEYGVLDVEPGTDFEYLVVGGGGGGVVGEYDGGSGGGGGGFLTGTVTTTNRINVITIGQGGDYGKKGFQEPKNGGDTSALGIIAAGGGHGTGRQLLRPPASGASGGGGTKDTSGDPKGTSTGAPGIDGQGHKGGDYITSNGGAGGGGAGGPGVDVDTSDGTPGGPGLESSIDGITRTYCEGGHGGGDIIFTSDDAPANTGNGGNGGDRFYDDPTRKGGKGASGIAIFRQEISETEYLEGS